VKEVFVCGGVLLLFGVALGGGDKGIYVEVLERQEGGKRGRSR
jgi:hypothetical protein